MSQTREKPFEGDFLIQQDVYSRIDSEACSHPRRETGGMLFGSFDETGDALTVSIEAVEMIPDEVADRTASHFGINPEYTDQILDRYCPEYTYLGNWHSHLNYGGPSQGDYRQIARFFGANENRDLVVAMIMDRQMLSPISFEPIIEVYRRAGAENEFDTYRVQEVRLVDSLDAQEDESGETKLRDEIDSLEIRQSLTNRLRALTEAFDERTSIDTDHPDSRAYLTDRGAGVEVIICVPIAYADAESATEEGTEHDAITLVEAHSHRADSEQNETAEPDQTEETPFVEGLLKFSIPANYPAEDIYIDLASRDLTKQMTVHTAPSAVLGDALDEFIDDINEGLGTHLPETLAQPLHETIRGQTRWSA